MSLTYILNPGNGHDAVVCANEREGIEAKRVALDAGNKWARLYRVAVLRHRDGKRVEYWETRHRDGKRVEYWETRYDGNWYVEYWETRYDGNWYESNRDNLPNKLLDLAATLA